MINLIAGTCLMLQGFVWKVDFVMQDHVKLSYPVVFRIDVDNKVQESTRFYAGLWKKDYVLKNSKIVKCTKNFK